MAVKGQRYLKALMSLSLDELQSRDLRQQRRLTVSDSSCRAAVAMVTGHTRTHSDSTEEEDVVLTAVEIQEY
ncbi:Hypothetical predicted protein [Xyrichtys novacula]|uniref:Uncharacterized protein n=1 Tax=Xyrichtys novacula TaxID=13765 RepID=A0AAV1EZW4_XYRNO|nr:Hypothetical predicted protein [Xyrichtys novacula]